MMIQCIRTHSDHAAFQKLVLLLDADLRMRDGDEHDFYAQFNKITSIQHVVVAYENMEAVGCGAFKHYNNNTVEIKRMFVLQGKRNKGIASMILKELEQWASELNYQKCCLETGKKQPEAIALYTKNGFTFIPNFGPYENVENSVCMEKLLSL